MDQWTPVWIVVGAILGVGLLLVIVILRKSRKLAGDHVFRASRWSRKNRIFPAQVVITQSSITLYKPQWIGKLEESIHMAHVASIKIDTHLIFSDVYIETSGGQDPITCHGHTKGDATEMKRLIERFQSDYYKKDAGAPRP